jgi:hypothetical protein
VVLRWGQKEAVELVPENGKEAETNRLSKSGCCVWDTVITRVPKRGSHVIRCPRGGDKIPDVGCQDSKEIKESVHFVGHSTGSEERDGRIEPIQGDGGGT